MAGSKHTPQARGSGRGFRSGAGDIGAVTLAAITVHFVADTIGFTTLMGFFGLPHLYNERTVRDTGVDAGFVIALLMAAAGAWASVAILRRVGRMQPLAGPS